MPKRTHSKPEEKCGHFTPSSLSFACLSGFDDTEFVWRDDGTDSIGEYRHPPSLPLRVKGGGVQGATHTSPLLYHHPALYSCAVVAPVWTFMRVEWCWRESVCGC